MGFGLRQLAHLARLIRLEHAASAVSNVWLMLFLARGLEETTTNSELSRYGLPAALGITMLIAGGLVTHGLALNDAMDVRHDRAFSPDRPVAAGRVSMRTAVTIALLGLIVAIGAAVFLGRESMLLCLAAALMTLSYNTMAKYVPAAGLLLLGLVRAANMFVPEPRAAFLWPIWLTMTHVVVCASVLYVVEGRRPRLRGADWIGLVAGWTFWTFALVGWIRWVERGVGPPMYVMGHRWLWVWPLVAVAAFVFVGSRMLDTERPRERREAAERFARAAALWLIVYDAAWLAGAWLFWQSALLVGLLALVVLLNWLAGALTRWSDHTPRFEVRPSEQIP